MGYKIKRKRRKKMKKKLAAQIDKRLCRERI